VGNLLPGCCLVFDRRLLELILPIPKSAIMHDWWILLVFSLAGNVQGLAGATTFYRLHEDNSLGINTVSQSLVKAQSSGVLNTLRSNLLAAIMQSQSGVRRLEQQGLTAPQGIEAFYKCFSHGRFLRPLKLYRLGITRGAPGKTLRMLFASTLLGDTTLQTTQAEYQ